MNEQAILNLTKQLITIPSTADQPKELDNALEVIAGRVAQNKNITIERFTSDGKPSLLAYAGKNRPEKFRVLLNGHLDVVAANKEQFSPKQKNGRLYGRGTLDMKTAVVVLTQVFCDLADKLPYSIGLQIVTDEEVGGHHGTFYQLEQGIATEFAIAGECTPAGGICNEARGICWAELTFSGIAAHSAYLWNGQNALLKTQDFVRKLTKAIPTPKAEVWQSTANVAMVATPNTTFNRVPDKATVGIDIRYIAEDKRFVSRDSAVEFLQSLAPDATITLKLFEPSHYANPDDPYLKALSRAVETTTEHPAHYIRKHGGADTRFFSAQGIPAVTFGLQGAHLHGDDEHVELASIMEYYDTLSTFLAQL